MTYKQKSTVDALTREGWKISRKDERGAVWMITPPQHPATGARVFRNGNLRADYFDETKGYRVAKTFYASQFEN